MKEFLQDVDKQLSSKRLLLASSVLVVIAAAVLNLAFGIVMAEFMFEGFMYVIMVGILSVASEKFSRRSSDNQTIHNFTISDYFKDNSK